LGLFGKKKGKGQKVMVLSIDGTPFSFLKQMFKEDRMPNLAEVADGGSMRRMHSVLPVVSSVQWATFQSGKNPGKRGIFGFVDRVPDSYKIYLPNGADLEGDVLWEVLSHQGRKVFAMNVPESYPPREVNGITIGGFLCPTVDKVAYPSSVNQVLKKMGYVIDAEPWVAHEDLDRFIDLVFNALEKRAQAAMHFYEKEGYDLFMVHIMESDRINHFLWSMYTSGMSQYKDKFLKFYKKVDDVIGMFMKARHPDTELIVMSDHGFCDLECEVNTNRWLADQGFLEFPKEKKEMALPLDPSKTQVYSMIPGRFYVNLKGREPEGIVKKGEEMEKVIDALTEALHRFKFEDDRRIIDKVHRREELYHGPHLERAPDVISHPVDGFDLKAGGEKVPLYKNGPLVGMHTYHDATFITSGTEIPKSDFSILDTTRTVLKMMGAKAPDDMDGEPLF